MNKIKKKLIEVALPLEAINRASAHEKTIKHGHPSTLHLWWARRPLAAARAVIFAQMVDDPSSYPDLFKTERAQEKERQRLFKIIEDLVQWENTNNEDVLKKAREEIWQSWRRACAENSDHPRAKELFDRNKLPAFHDPFAGGGSLPLEAQRLGLEAFASDLNPVAVLINKAMIEIPPKFANRMPVNPEWQKNSIQEKTLQTWKGAKGLAEDVRYYGQWMRNEAEKKIGHLYPKIEITATMAKDRPDLKPYVSKSLTVIAWLWARTVKSPNPAFRNVDVPLVSTFMISTKPGKEAYVEPVIEGSSYQFIVKVGKPKNMENVKTGTKLSQGAFKCLLSGSPFKYEYIDNEANAGRMNARLMAIVAEGERGRIYISPTKEHEKVPQQISLTWKPDTPSRGTWASNAQGRRYGFYTFGDYFTPRQLVALTTFSDLLSEVRERIQKDALAAGMAKDGQPLRDEGTGAHAYSEAVGVYLGFVLSKQADLGNSLCAWEPIAQCPRHLFSRQAIPMVWDYAEGNVLGKNSGAWMVFVDGIVKAFIKTFHLVSKSAIGHAQHANATDQKISLNKLISTDPPYYDNIGYADLSDFFYVWARRSMRVVFPDLFVTFVAPKNEELVATPYRHGSKENAEAFFLDGMEKALHCILEQAHPVFPVTIYYAFKQRETESEGGISSTGWETFLDAVIRAGFGISGTWPMRTENVSRMIGQGTNALASSIVLVCRPRYSDAPIVTRREFIATLKDKLPHALVDLQKGNIAPVDFAQAAIGPGMAIFCRFKKIVESDGASMSVRSALQLINQELDSFLARQEEDMDPDTRFCLTWFEQYGAKEGLFGEADVLARAKNTSVQAMADDGIIASKAGKVRLVKRDELMDDWEPEKDKRLTIWECTQHLVRRLSMSGEDAAAQLVARLGGARSEESRALSYRLYSICEKKKWAQEALEYNSLVIAWPEITRMALSPRKKDEQGRLF